MGFFAQQCATKFASRFTNEIRKEAKLRPSSPFNGIHQPKTIYHLPKLGAAGALRDHYPVWAQLCHSSCHSYQQYISCRFSFNCKHTREVLISHHADCLLECQDFSFMVALDNKSRATILLGNDRQWSGGAAAYPFQVFFSLHKTISNDIRPCQIYGLNIYNFKK